MPFLKFNKRRVILFAIIFDAFCLFKLYLVPTHDSVVIEKEKTGIKVSSAIKAKARTSSHSHDPQSKSKCTPLTVAIMIAGQFGRFTFRDNLGPLVTSSSVTWGGCGEPIVDVYIALHRGKLSKPYKGRVSAAPYMNDNLTIVDIQNYYLQKMNASNVHVLFVDDDHMSKVDEDTLHQVTIAQNIPLKARELFENEFSPSSGYSTLFSTRMFYLNHLVYTMTLPLQDQNQYDIYVRLREDNFFYEPLNLDFAESDYNASQILEATRTGQPFVIVEKWCQFGGPSVKIHVGNQLGMSTLYGNDRNDFFGLMIRYAEFGHNNEGFPKFHTESFLQSLLVGAGATVHKADLKRVDVRYIEMTRCVLSAYYRCLPQSAKLALSEKFAIEVC